MPTVTVTVTRSAGVDPIADLDAFVGEVEGLPGEIATQGAKAAQAAILDSVVAQRGTLSMSGLGTFLDVTATVNDTGATAEAILLGEPRHAWRFAQGTEPHGIAVDRRLGRAMRTPYGIYSRVEHPGTPRIDLLTPAYEAADAAVDELAGRLADEVITGG